MPETADGSTPRELLAAFHRALIGLSADDLADLHAPDAVVIAEQELTAVDLATNEPFVLPFLLVLRARDGRIVHTRDHTARRPGADVARPALSLELVTVPVSDVDRAKAFYVEQVGFRAGHDHQIEERHRFVRLTPPGSACSIALATGYADARPGSLKGVQLVVEDIGPVHARSATTASRSRRSSSSRGAASASSPTPTATAGRCRSRPLNVDRPAIPNGRPAGAGHRRGITISAAMPRKRRQWWITGAEAAPSSAPVVGPGRSR